MPAAIEPEVIEAEVVTETPGSRESRPRRPKGGFTPGRIITGLISAIGGVVFFFFFAWIILLLLLIAAIALIPLLLTGRLKKNRNFFIFRSGGVNPRGG